MAVSPLSLSGLNHISHACSDISVTRDFYKNVLGFFEVKRPQSIDCSGYWCEILTQLLACFFGLSSNFSTNRERDEASRMQALWPWSGSTFATEPTSTQPSQNRPCLQSHLFHSSFLMLGERFAILSVLFRCDALEYLFPIDSSRIRKCL